jgi:hypothetical protein
LPRGFLPQERVRGPAVSSAAAFVVPRYALGAENAGSHRADHFQSLSQNCVAARITTSLIVVSRNLAL